jgi:response regulator RpfG family c-di-GMP phosphodiesterase
MERLTMTRVLIVDPDEFLLAAYREVFQTHFAVATAPNALKCVQRLREVVPDVLVLEPHLLWGGGDGVLSIMHDEPRLAAVPVMILTSCRDPHILKSVAPFPISDYHVKPVAPADLVTRIHRLFDHGRRHARVLEVRRRLERWNARRTQAPVVE